jgi:hypothetical protein
VLFLLVDLLALLAAVELVDKVHGLGLAELVLDSGLLVDLLNGNVFDSNGDDALLVTKTKVDLFFLVDFKNVEVTAAGPAGKNPGDHSTVEYGSEGVVTRSVLEEFGRSEEGEDGLVQALGKVDHLVDLVNLVVGPAEAVESLEPGLLTVFLFFAGSLDGRVLLGEGKPLV